MSKGSLTTLIGASDKGAPKTRRLQMGADVHRKIAESTCLYAGWNIGLSDQGDPAGRSDQSDTQVISFFTIVLMPEWHGTTRA